MKALVKISNNFTATECNLICNLENIADDWYTFMFNRLSPYQLIKLKSKFGYIGMYYAHAEIIKVYGVKQSNLEINGKEVRIKNYSK